MDLLKQSGVFGLTVALSQRAGIPYMIGDPISTALISSLGAPLARDVGIVVAFGAIAWVYNGYIWPWVRPYLG